MTVGLKVAVAVLAGAVLGLGSWVVNASERIARVETMAPAVERRLARIEDKLDRLDAKVVDMDDVAKALGVRRWSQEELERRGR